MTKESVNEATLEVVASLQEASKAVAENLVAIQQRNVEFAQNLFSSGVEVLKSNSEGTKALLQELEQQAQKQQQAFQKLAEEMGQSAKQELEQQIQKQQETFQRVARELEEQTQKQQEAFQKLMQSSLKTPIS
jgi:hypothetical protein